MKRHLLKMFNQHPEAIRKAAWKYKAYGIVTAVLSEVKEKV